jgi:hypothetical protein
MLRLLQDVVSDVDEPVGIENPLRQVIVNTHSPTVVAQVPLDSLLLADVTEAGGDGRHFRRLSFSCLPNTWRERAGTSVMSRGRLLSFLNPVSKEEWGWSKLRRVIDDPAIQMHLPGVEV